MRGNGNLKAAQAPQLITRESDAWFLLAKSYTPFPSGGDDAFFLCDWLNVEYGKTADFHRAVPRQIRVTMVNRICEDLEYGGDAYENLDAVDVAAAARRSTEARRLACLMFGWEALDREQLRDNVAPKNHSPETDHAA